MSELKKGEILGCIELLYMRTGMIATPGLFMRHLGVEISDNDLEKVLTDPTCLEQLRKKGLPVGSEKTPISDKQLETIRIILDPSDSRPLSLKLKGLGVTSQQYSNWMLNQHFVATLRDSAENYLVTGGPRIIKSLVDEASSGNIRAQQLYFALTGRYDPSNKSVNVNINSETKQIVSSILEILQEEVDTDTLLRIADRLEAVLFPSVPEPVRTHTPPPLADPRQLVEIEEYLP